MKTIFSIICILLAVVGPTLADPGLPDTVRVDSVSAAPGGKVVLPVYFYNDEALGQLDLVLKHDSSRLVLDSFSLAGGRLAYIPMNTVNSYISGDTFALSVQDWMGWIPRGKGLLCNLYFSVKVAAAGQTITIDSTFRAPAWQTLFVDSSADNSFIPQFVKGHITVAELPPNSDSIWVDTLTAPPGATVSVKIYGFNQESLSGINLALNYSSSNLIYNSVHFENTRGAQAFSRIINSNPQDRQLLISLAYDVATPLEAGSGPLATIEFNIASGAPDEKATIDSASYLGIQRLEYIPLVGESFGPYFRAGYVDIKASSPVDDRERPKIPTDFALAQNYPNPFNPTTVIRFDLPKAENVTLELFNILGQKIRTLIDRRLSAGTYNISFDGRGDDKKPLASGIYLYRLEAGQFSQSRTMMLLK